MIGEKCIVNNLPGCRVKKPPLSQAKNTGNPSFTADIRATDSRGRGLPQSYYVSAHLLRVIKLVNKLVYQKGDPLLCKLDLAGFLSKAGESHRLLDYIDSVVEIKRIITRNFDEQWQSSSRSRLYDVRFDNKMPSSELCRRLLTNHRDQFRPLDAYVCFWVSRSAVSKILPWRKVKTKSGQDAYVLELSDYQSPLNRAIWFTFEGTQYRILLCGRRAVRHKTRKRVGANKRLEKTSTTEITVNDSASSLTNADTVRTRLREIDSVKKLLIEATKLETGPSIPRGLEF